MKVRHSLRLMLLAFLVCLIPVSSHAAVFISVGFAPPPLPVYEQPPCPQPGWMWTPGYWAYGDDGYYWVPGTWVPAPYEGALWTPGYWGWSANLYVWHPGYWGRHVGYYGGVDYGFGYRGIGFVGGVWAGSVFRYNTAAVRVNTTVIHNTYVDRTVVERNTIVNDRHVAYSGGPGGINHRPTAEEDRFSHEQHMAPTSFQVQHRDAAMHDHSSYFNSNHGHPNNTAMERPMSGPPHGNFNNNAGRPNNGNMNDHQGGRGNFTTQPEIRGPMAPHNELNHGNQSQPLMHEQHNNPNPQPQFHEQHNNPQPQMHEQHNNPQPQMREQHNNPQPHEQHGPPPNQGHEHDRGH